MKRFGKWFLLLLSYILLTVIPGRRADASASIVREGIDVSGYSNKLANGTWKDIDWNKVKASGKEFVFVRCGYRGPTDDELCKDSYFEKNLKGALDAGLDVGVYFVTQAINEAEARQEADYALSLVNGVLKQKSSYELRLPIVIDFEDESGNSNHRLSKKKLSVAAHNAICKAFCSRIESKGFTAGYYTSSYNLKTHFTEKELSANYPLWYAKYGTLDKSDMAFVQYKASTAVSGVPVGADLNRQYITTPKQVKKSYVEVTNAGALWVNWSKVPGVYGYQIYRTSSKDQKEKLIATVKGAGAHSYRDRNVEQGVTYTYRVRAFLKTTKNGAVKNYYGSFSPKTTRKYAIYKVALKANGGKISSGNVTSYVYGNKVSLPTKITRKGYLFGGWYTDKACTKNKTTTITATASGNKTFYAKWTKVKVAAPTIKSVKNVKGKKMQVTLKKKVSGADGYWIKYSLKSNMKSATTVTVKKGSYLTTTIKKLKKGKKYYVRVYAYRYDSTGAKIASSSSSKVSVKIKK